MAATGRDIVVWNIAFYGRARNVFERVLFKPGFRHCIAFAWIDTDRWLEVQPSFFRLRVRILTGPQYSRRLIALTRAKATITPASVRGGDLRVPRIATCAGALAHIIGVRGALLPHGLYRALGQTSQAASGCPNPLQDSSAASAECRSM